MSAGKIGALVVYAVLAALALTQGGTQLGSIANWIIVGLIVVHTLEVIIFFKLCREASGSMAGHLLQVFAFGYFHVKELKATQA
jgi:uncharacterized protein YhhL (DUF1145 family)